MENNTPTRLSQFLKKLRPFFDFRIESLEDVISILLGLGVFGIIVFRAYFIDITYDEAYTYLNTGRIQDVWTVYLFRIANTHLLNSLLMTVTTLAFPYNDLAIRLPSVFISIFYLTTSISLSKKFQNRLSVLGLLLLFYYVIEYMALARGYGMSATFILAAFFVYKDKNRFPAYYLWITYFFILAIYSSYVAVIPYGLFMIYMFIVDFKGRLPKISVKNKRWIIGLTGLAIYGLFSVTKAGKPMPTTNKHTFIEAIPLDLISRFLNIDSVPPYLAVIGLLTLSFLIISIFVLSKGKNVFGVITFLTFSTIFLVNWVSHKQLPSGRVLIPYWPFIALTIVEIVDFITTRLPKVVVRSFNIIVIGVLIFNFQLQLDFIIHIKSKSEQWKKPITILSDYSNEFISDESYYLEKEWQHNLIFSKLENRIPDEELNNSGVKFKIYDHLALITVSFPNQPKGVKLYREVIKSGVITYSDTISLDSKVYNFEKNRPMLLPYPRMGGEILKIGNMDGSWEQFLKIPDGMETFFPPKRGRSFN